MTALHNWHYQNITQAMPKHQDGSFGQCCKEHVSGVGTSAEGFWFFAESLCHPPEL